MSTAEPVGRRAEREREILDAAAKLFRAQGYASTTIRDIGAEAQLNHASSHYYFGSKAAILFAIYSDALDGFLDRFESIPDGDPETTLTEIIRASVLESARRPDHTAVFFQERLLLEIHLTSQQAAGVRDRQRRFRSRTAGIVERGIAEGVFTAVDPGLAVELIVGAATWAYQRSEAADAEAADRCAQLIVRGLLSERREP
ncbi:MAG TPA: TetR/AcrR family transcriptional regulator [Pseudonocardia sp.]|nr:TetR/AcrR family transcriptional regulator [Pseudonocardia sp.]